MEVMGHNYLNDDPVVMVTSTGNLGTVTMLLTVLSHHTDPVVCEV